ncbi:hypothetical protein [Candidatus Thalassolituus haligoni]|uniref:hypothetical protein n=1 Tax=Candidatus Thalassolituus haligoni TaxID=3100113 RepID=UPI003517084C|tara:strand:- start:28411 stop:29100 length:690 start_codon:yes stop_codon:yes gene_type:complete
MKQSGSDVVSAGIDELVNRLRQDGVEAGETAAAAILADARQQAAALLADATRQAEQLVADAQQQAQRQQQAAAEAMQIAFRDLVLDMKSMLEQRFSADVSRLVRQQIDQPQLLAKLVQAAAGRLLEQAELPPEGDLELLLPPHILALDDIRRAPESAMQGPLADLAFALQVDMLRDGVTLANRSDDHNGIKLVLRGQQVEVDLSDRAIAGLLLGYLQPRFRAILDGIIR